MNSNNRETTSPGGNNPSADSSTNMTDAEYIGNLLNNTNTNATNSNSTNSGPTNSNSTNSNSTNTSTHNTSSSGNNSSATGNGNGNTSPMRRMPSSASSNSGNTSSSSSRIFSAFNRSHRAELGLFDRFRDTVSGLYRSNRTSREGSHQPNSATQTSTDIPTVVPQAAQLETTATIDTSGPTTGPSALTFNSESDYTRAIVITVNYVFSDENNPQYPNRAGSLIMSLPNNSSNRDPRVIQEFIRLATQMAYSTIINGLHKEKGVTLCKFNSFPSVKEADLGDSRACSICFDEFDMVEAEKEKSLVDESDDELVVVKKRRIDELRLAATSESNSRVQSDDESDSAIPPSNNILESTSIDSTNTDLPNTDPASTSNTNPTNTNTPSTNEELAEPKYLSEYTGVFDHSPIRMTCGHIFGKDCLSEWLKEHTTCPLCRDSVAEPTSRTNSSNVTIFNLPTNSSRPTTTEAHVDINETTTPQEETSIDSDTVYREADRFHYFPLSGGSARPLRRVLRSGSGISDAAAEQTERDYSTSHSQFSHILGFLRRQRTGNHPEPLFPTGISSRRTANGIETRLTDEDDDAASEILDFMNLHEFNPPVNSDSANTISEAGSESTGAQDNNTTNLDDDTTTADQH